jgi:hypothetical protein
MKRKSRVCGAYPQTLYRCFTKKEYAVQFVEEGKFRVGLLKGYKIIECAARRDPTEGEGVYQRAGRVVAGRFSLDPKEEPVWTEEDGVQKHHTENLNSIFPFCCSNTSADLEKMKSLFGPYAVKIVSPVSLAIEMDYFLNGDDGKSGPFLVSGKDVEYNKELLIEDGRTPEELTDLAYTQKPAKFSEEKEFRFCLMALGEKYLQSNNSTDYLTIDLGCGRNSYAKML